MFRASRFLAVEEEGKLLASWAVSRCLFSEWCGRVEGPWVAALQVGVTEWVRVGSSSVECSVTNVLPQLTKCRAERVRMAWYSVVTATNTKAAADTGVSVSGHCWAGLGSAVCDEASGGGGGWRQRYVLTVLGENKSSPDLQPGAAQYSGMTLTECWPTHFLPRHFHHPTQHHTP